MPLTCPGTSQVSSLHLATLPPIRRPGGLYLGVLLAMVVGFYLLLLACLAATAWLLWEVILWTPTFLEHVRGSGAIKLLLVIYAAIGIFGWAIVRGIFVKAGGDPYGIKADRARHAQVFQLTDEVAAKVNASPIEEVFITPEDQLGVWEESALYLPPGTGKRKLVLGMAALNYLTLDQLKSVLAHEYGHFSHKDTFFSRFIYRVSTSYSTLVNNLSDMKIQLANPLYWLILGYVKTYDLLAAAFSRRQEFAADRFAVEAYGGTLFRDALIAAHREGSFFGQVGLRTVVKLAQEGKAFKNVYCFVGVMRKVHDRDESQNVRQVTEAILQQRTGMFDSHPSLRERLEAQGQPATISDGRPPRVPAIQEAQELLEKPEDAPLVAEGPASAAEALFGPALPAIQSELSDMLAGKYMYLLQMARQAQQAE